MSFIEQETYKKILIIDDSPTTLVVAAEGLKKHHDVRVVHSGNEALSFLENEQVDLILLDILMPEMDGYEVISRLKARDKIKGIPVIFLTMLTETEDEKKGFSLGAVDFIRKPIVPELLLARVNIHLKLIDRQKQLEQANGELQKALSEIKTLKGILPLCTFCKKIRTGRHEWMEIEKYITVHSEADVSHGICPDCLKTHYPEGADAILEKYNKVK